MPSCFRTNAGHYSADDWLGCDASLALIPMAVEYGGQAIFGPSLPNIIHKLCSVRLICSAFNIHVDRIIL